ncbi:aldo/keto reductase [Candidatus Bathyarchaeota archaeon]|nr:aldo/keto reductase [Candidatus Bathyarchaeota archaeon]
MITAHILIASALKKVPRKEVAISTKTYAKSGQEANESLKSSRKELETDYLGIYLLHFVKSDWVDDCHDVLKEMKNLKANGTVRAIGLSTHSVAVVRKAAQFEELDVIMAICCRTTQSIIRKFLEGIPIEDGSMEEMFQALKQAHNNGKGTIAMKVLGAQSPPLIKNY